MTAVTAVFLLLLRAALAQPAEPPRPITVRPAPGVTRSLSVVLRSAQDDRGAAAERYVRADRLAQALDGTLAPVAAGSDVVRLRLAGVAVDVTPEAPYVKIGDELVPLAAAPQRDGDRLWLPLQLVTDVLPRAGRGLLYDTTHRELRAFSTVASAPKPESPKPDTPKPDTPKAASPRAEAPKPKPEPSSATTTPRATPPPAAPTDIARAAPAPRPRGAHVVVVDAGHGGVDSGMSGSGVEEKDVTLGIARQLDAALRARGVGVVMTRTRDTLVALADRGRIANQQNGELFISIHVNAANPSWRNAAGFRGFETYFLADAKSEDARQVAVRENESTKYETGPSTAARPDPLGFILSDMAQNENQRESSRLATLVQRRLAKVHPGPSHGVKQAGFVVLITASMPAVLVEVGFGTNAQDAAFISSPRGQRLIAGAIADATVEYLSRAERVGGDAGANR